MIDLINVQISESVTITSASEREIVTVIIDLFRVIWHNLIFTAVDYNCGAWDD